MDRFYDPQPFDRVHGPAPGASTDGITQGTAYSAVIRSSISKGLSGVEGPKNFIKVSIPSLHLTEVFSAHVQPNTPCQEGQTCLVIFDDQKIPWVITGEWEYPNVP